MINIDFQSHVRFITIITDNFLFVLLRTYCMKVDDFTFVRNQTNDWSINYATGIVAIL